MRHQPRITDRRGRTITRTPSKSYFTPQIEEWIADTLRAIPETNRSYIIADALAIIAGARDHIPYHDLSHRAERKAGRKRGKK